MEEYDESNPPLLATYKHLFDADDLPVIAGDEEGGLYECDLPVINLAPLLELEHASSAAEACRAEMVRAASEWGFFQVTNHGVPQPLLDELHAEQVRAFRRPFHRKLAPGDLDEPLLSPEAYRWGTPTATCLHQLSWSEAYHIPTTTPSSPETKTTTTRRVIDEVSTAMSSLARRILSVLAEEHGPPETETTTCFLRLNRYPPAGSGGHGILGLCGHTDSDFLTILRQDDHVGGLQLLLDNGGSGGRRWLTVKPNPGALIVNVGDLLQAWTNDLYASVEHRVVAHPDRERFSVAFFLCPSYDTLIRPPLPLPEPGKTTPQQVYRNFTFGEYRSQVMEDVRLTGRKVGLPRFRRHVSTSPSSMSSPGPACQSHTLAKLAAS